jgi:hypothetical protein
MRILSQPGVRPLADPLPLLRQVFVVEVDAGKVPRRLERSRGPDMFTSDQAVDAKGRAERPGLIWPLVSARGDAAVHRRAARREGTARPGRADGTRSGAAQRAGQGCGPSLPAILSLLSLSSSPGRLTC